MRRTMVVAAMALGCGGPGTWPGVTPNSGTTGRARIFAPGIVSDDHTFMVTFTPDRRTAYVATRRYPTRGAPPVLQIAESRLVDGGWTRPVVAPFSGQYSDIDPVLSPDGRRLYFNSDRPAPGRDPDRTDFDIWHVDRVGNGWTEPVRLPEPINTPSSEVYASVTSEGVLYFSRSSGTGSDRRTVLLRAPPAPGGSYPALDTVAFPGGWARDAGNPFIAPDESYLLLSSRRRSGQDSDLFLSRRRNGTWSEPEALGTEINTPLAEFAPSVSPDGKHLFFARMERGSDGLAVRENVMVIEWAGAR